MEKQKALEKFLNTSVNELQDNYFETENGESEYLVLNDDEADEHLTEYIEQSISYFVPSFLSWNTKIPEIVFEKLTDENEAVLEIVNETCGIEQIVEEAENSDGRGHFLSGYDGQEHEQDGYYIYRVN